MNRLFNRVQWDEFNNLILTEIRLILMKMLMIEVYNLMLHIVQTTIYILYALFLQILDIIKLMINICKKKSDFYFKIIKH